MHQNSLAFEHISWCYVGASDVHTQVSIGWYATMRNRHRFCVPL